MIPFDMKDKHFQILESVFLGAIFPICVVILPILANHKGILVEDGRFFFSYIGILKMSRFTSFFLISSAFNCIFLKFSNKTRGVLITSLFDTVLYFLLILFYFLLRTGWEWAYLGGLTFFLLSIPLGICRVIFIKILPLKRSNNFIKSYYISFSILLYFEVLCANFCCCRYVTESDVLK